MMTTMTYAERRFRDSKAGRRAALMDTLQNIGFTFGEALQLIRIEMTLHRWAEHDCNGNIQREGAEAEGKPRWFSTDCLENVPHPKGYPIPDRERGALKRLSKIIGDANARRSACGAIGEALTPGPLFFYHQTDPRWAALYILRPGDVPAGKDAGAYYSRGICVCGR